MKIDAELRALVQRGDLAAAQEWLVRAHQVPLQKFIRSRFRERGEVEDLCQEVWAAALVALPRFQFQAMSLSWLLGIAKHKVLDAQRRPRRLEPAVEPSPLDALLGLKSVSTPTSKLQKVQRAAAVQSALAELEPSDRQALELRHMLELTPAEIAELLGIKSEAVRQRIVRAKRRLRQLLAGHELFRPEPEPTAR